MCTILDFLFNTSKFTACRVKACYACPSCDQVIFCSQTCTEAALKYHRIECPVLSTIWESEVSVTCHMSFRIITQQPLDYFISKKQSLEVNCQFVFHAKSNLLIYNADYMTNISSLEEQSKGNSQI